MENVGKILETVDNLLWGLPLIVLIMGTGILLTTRLRVLQFRKLGLALKYMVKNESCGSGEVSSFAALCTALAATIGTGNIVGVATAVVAGGPGALFWMVVAAFFGMATKYSEGLLAIKYRTIDEDGHTLGGPFYYIEKGMGIKWKWLAQFFALFGMGAGLLGIGTITQVNGIASAVKRFFDPNDQMMISMLGSEYSVATVVAAVVVAAATALVVIGGVKRIASVSSIVVPFMAVAYIIACLSILIYNAERIPEGIVTIVSSALGLKAAAGGMAGAMIVAMQKGIARGIFSNEAGLGSAPIATSAAQTNEPVRQGLVSMTGTFIDTIVICTMTGLTIVVTDSYDIGLKGVEVTISAFSNGLPWSPQVGACLLMVCLTFFAFTTILGWDYYSEKCLEYLSNGNRTMLKWFKRVWILAVLCGPFISLESVWILADIMNGLMALPNLIALLALNGVVVRETKNYFTRLGKGEI